MINFAPGAKSAVYDCPVDQVIAKGMALSEHAYLRSGWNIIDGTLVVISLVDLVISLTASTSPRIFGILRVFRLLRALKPLRYDDITDISPSGGSSVLKAGRLESPNVKEDT